MLTDEALMTKVKNDDLDSLIPLFNRYESRIYNFFFRYMRNEDNSKDMTQTVFTRVIQYRHSYNAEKTFKSWLFQMARNVRIDEYHKSRIFRESTQLSEYEGYTEINPMQHLEESDNKEALREAIRQLSVEEQEIIELHRYQGLKYEEISEITGSSVGSIKVKVHRSIKKLRKIYFQTV